MAMYRMLMRFTVVCTAVVLWSSGTTMAFTLQFGPDAPAHVVDEVYTTNGADVPTPQLFRVVIGHEEAHSGTASLSAAYSVAVPEMRVSIGRAVPAAPAPNSGTSRYLRGAELLLLRQAHTVAESPGQNRDGVRD